VRRSFQSAMEGRFRAGVEKATGRKVIAYLTQTHTDPDLAVELFVLDGRSPDAGSDHRPDGERSPREGPST
jgi:hypothetical protein